jgi:hypothetical protein
VVPSWQYVNRTRQINPGSGLSCKSGHHHITQVRQFVTQPGAPSRLMSSSVRSRMLITCTSSILAWPQQLDWLRPPSRTRCWSRTRFLNCSTVFPPQNRIVWVLYPAKIDFLNPFTQSYGTYSLVLDTVIIVWTIGTTSLHDTRVYSVPTRLTPDL